ncbi:porin family protein [Bacteroides sp. 519]|uniref:porin family protein n=1 Tax=Bacteroides sp. 519 TaxID=2302937 RepID=UPI0013D007BE|nr:porin family protein [Bacteroides sp. 519]NDV58995.1 PorT family protein [Bacteroides sp. 519]
MKKVILSVMVVLGLGASQVNAQNISYGVKADATMSNYILSDMDNMSSNMGIGFSVGGFAKWDITKNFAIQPELLINFRTSEFKDKGKGKRDFDYWGMEIPVYAMGQWYTANNSRFYAAVGPYIGYGFSARYKDPEYKLYKNDALKRFDFGFGTQVGYEFPNRISINASYKIGIIDSLDEGKDDATMLPQRVSLGVAYRF